MGHTPNFEGVLSRCDGLILLIDTGTSIEATERPSAAPTDDQSRYTDVVQPVQAFLKLTVAHTLLSRSCIR